MLTTYRMEEWLLEGERRFGPNSLEWRFVCPVCGNVQTPNDFKPYKDKGATPTSATSECIGRYTGASDFQEKGKGPCNYAGYGLFRLSPVRIIQADGDETHSFAFAETAAASAS